MPLQLFTLEEVKQSITMKQAITAMEKAFMQLASKQVQAPLRVGIPIAAEQALSLTMPAYLEQEQALGLKVVSIFPHNLAQNKPTITGFIMLLDALTGEPMALMDAAFLTALRTGAVSGLATHYFASEQARHVAIIGSGIQAETQLAAVAAVRNINRVSVWSRDSKNAEKFANKFSADYEFQLCSSIASAVADADIICTATSSLEPLIHLHDLQPHVHINAIGAHTPQMHELSNEVLAHARVFVDQKSAALAESGEIISAIAHQQLKQEDIIELGYWLLDKKPNYQNQLTVFKSVGLSIQDVSVAAVVYKNAMSKKRGTPFVLN